MFQSKRLVFGFVALVFGILLVVGSAKAAEKPKTEIEKARDVVTAAETAIENNNKAIKIAQEKIGTATADVVLAKSELEAKTKEASTEGKYKEAAAATLTYYRLKLEQASNTKKSAEEELEAAEKKVKGLTENLTSARKALDDLERPAKLERRVAELERKLAEVESVKGQIDRLDGRITVEENVRRNADQELQGQITALQNAFRKELDGKQFTKKGCDDLTQLLNSSLELEKKQKLTKDQLDALESLVRQRIGQTTTAAPTEASYVTYWHSGKCRYVVYQRVLNQMTGRIELHEVQ